MYMLLLHTSPSKNRTDVAQLKRPLHPQSLVVPSMGLNFADLSVTAMVVS